MKLTDTERERIADSVLKIQSVQASLEHIEKSKIPKREEVESCLKSVDHSFRLALGYARSEPLPNPPCKKGESQGIDSDPSRS